MFDLLVRLELNRPDAVGPYLDAVHGDFERRPLAEQLIDAIIAEDEQRYEDYRLVRARRQRTVFNTDEPDEIHRQIGHFLSTWVELERLLRKVANRPVVPNGRQLAELDLVDAEAVAEYEQLRRMRNLVVHGIETPPPDYLLAAARRVTELAGRIRLSIATAGPTPSQQ